MPIAIDPRRTEEFVLEEERDASLPTVFEIRGLTVRERAEVADAFYTAGLDGSVAYTPHKAKLLASRHGLVGWRSFRDVAGNAFEPTRGQDGRAMNVGDALERLGLKHVVAIGDAVLRLSKITEDESGN